VTTVEAMAALAARVRIERRHPHEAFIELWVDGRMICYCANLGTAVTLGAARIGIDAPTFTAIQGSL